MLLITFFFFYISCALYCYYYYISSTSDHQALDPGGWGLIPGLEPYWYLDHLILIMEGACPICTPCAQQHPLTRCSSTHARTHARTHAHHLGITKNIPRHCQMSLPCGEPQNRKPLVRTVRSQPVHGPGQPHCYPEVARSHRGCGGFPGCHSGRLPAEAGPKRGSTGRLAQCHNNNCNTNSYYLLFTLPGDPGAGFQTLPTAYRAGILEGSILQEVQHWEAKWPVQGHALIRNAKAGL